MTWYTTQSYYNDAQLISPCPILLTLSTSLGGDKYQFDKSLVWFGLELNSRSATDFWLKPTISPFLTHFYYPDTELTSPWSILVKPIAKLGSDKNQLRKSFGLTHLDFKLPTFYMLCNWFCYDVWSVRYIELTPSMSFSLGKCHAFIGLCCF